MTAQTAAPDTGEARSPSPPPPVIPLAAAGLVAALIGAATAVAAGLKLRSYNHDGPVSTVVAILLVVACLLPFLPAFVSLKHNTARGRHLSEGDVVASRQSAADGREAAHRGIGYGVAAIIVAGVLLLTLINDAGIARVFFSPKIMLDNADVRADYPGDFATALWINIYVSIAAMILVLIFGLIIAVMRMLPGRAGRPLRLIATVYTDVFRGIPAIITLVLVATGLPLTNLPLLSDLSLPMYGVLALTMTYSAYVAEVYRAGMDSIHPSQTAAARSLGLSQGMTLRTVVIPQAVRRVVPPLLNDFISLQKDTALLSAVGIIEVFNLGKQYQSQYFTFFPGIIAAVTFVILTIPQARYCDYLLGKQRKKLGGA